MKRQAILILILHCGRAVAQDAATIGGVSVSMTELDLQAADRLTRVRNDEYLIRRQTLETLITRKLLEREAAARKLTVADLEKAEITSKVVPVTDEQKRAVREASPEKYQAMPEAQALAQIELNLATSRLAETRRRFMTDLRSKFGVKVFLDPPRTKIDGADGPARGPVQAPVTIVEFSDFQCPYCARVTPTLKQIQDRYKDKVRLVFKDFPLDIHKDATKAAEAGQCAAEQGKFWEVHDRMFLAQQKLQADSLKAMARDAGLDANTFAACLDSGRTASRIRESVAYGQRHGVSATPAFFINGRFLSGAQAFDRFAEVIDDELARLKP